MNKILNMQSPNIVDVIEPTARCKERFTSWGTARTDDNIAEAGIDELHPGYILGRTRPRFHLLLYTLKGQGKVYTPNEVRLVEKGDLLLVPARVTFGYIPQENPWKLMWVHLPDNRFWAKVKGSEIKVNPTILTDYMERAVEGYFSEAHRDGETAQEAAKLYSDLISVYVERELSHERLLDEEPIYEQLDRLWDTVRKDLGYPWTVEMLAKVMGMSAPHLYRVVKSKINMSPMQKVTQLRMDYAQEWLMLYDQPIRNLAEQVGYINEFAFATAFKRFSGDSPGKFRKRR